MINISFVLCVTFIEGKKPQDGGLQSEDNSSFQVAEMKVRISDTPPQIQEVLIKGYRSMTVQEKMRRVTELNKTVQQLALARIRKDYGNISEREQRLRLAALWLDRGTMICVFGWDPQKEGY